MSRGPEFHVPPPGEVLPHSWVVVGDMVISLTQPGDSSLDRWKQYCAALAAAETRVYLGGGIGNITLNSVQRKMAADSVKGKQVTAVVDSAVARGVVTAVRWLGVDIQAFAWRNIDEAIARVNTRVLSPQEIKANLDELLVRSGAPSLAELAAAKK